MKPLGLKIMLVHGHEILDTMPEAEANDILRRWAAKEWGPERMLKRDTPQGWGWVVRVENVVAMHTFIVPAEPPPQPNSRPGPIGGPFRPGISGMN